ncbi:golgin subfamily A member 6-like protein 1 [Xyrichtys novacula]|uniref:Golgin subfamily A member 6-like protein 1 n=1 Tax=Xyrichtys novacula TaxID=13765 RepID=A0AAV1FJC6_XYRNO|nr:golgin subfamily A member 6-like protein 1 [Xyrichtys novacula]
MSSSTSRMEQNRTEEATNYDYQGFDSEEELNPLPSGVGQDSEDSEEQDQIGSPDSVNKSSPEETKKSVKRGLISRMKAISVQTFAQESILNVRSRVRRRLAHRRRQEADSSDTSMLLESEDSLSNEIITTEDQHTNSESEEVWPSTALCKSDCERRLDEAQKCHIEKVAELEREKEEIQATKENLFSQVSCQQDESITNERNRSLLTEKVASLKTRLDEKERENENLVAEIGDLKERNWRQEKHYREKVFHPTTALEQAQDRERALNQQVTSLQTSFNETQDRTTQLRVALHDCQCRLYVAQKCHIEKVAELEREKEEIQAIKENLFSQVSRLQDESITNERNRSLLTEKVASLETRLDEKERENENLVAEIDDLKERNWRQEKHYGEKVLHLTRDLQQAQDRERALNQQVTSLQTLFNKTQDRTTQLRVALHDCQCRLDEAQKCHIEKVAELEREKEEIQAIKENLFSQVSRLQDESITNERNRSLLTEKVASLETRLDEKERENENLVAEIDDLKERNWRQEKHYGEKVLHLTTALEQAQDRERALNQQVTSLQTSFNKTQDEATQLRAALHDCERRLGEAQKCHIEKVAELEREKEEIQAIKENLFSQVSRLQDESITNERNRSLLTEKVASLETRLDEKGREIDDLKERNWRQEKHYGEKVLHLTTALEQAQDRERTLNQHSEETISKLREELKAKQEEEILAPSERHLNSTGVQTDEISPEPQQLETPAAEAQSESLWKRSLRGALSVGKFIGVSAAYALVAVGILSIGLSAHCDCPGHPF